MITVNSQYFREPALYFQKHGKYDDGVDDSYDYHDYWEREHDRCINGLSVGGMHITGYHYYYLNYCPIWLTRAKEQKLYGEVFKNRKTGDRIFDFADFWDVDFEFFSELELAIDNGQHFIWLKPRGVGASYKGSSILGRNFFLKPGSKNYILAQSKEFLTNDGLFTKFLSNRSFINKPHPEEDRYLTAFGKPSDFKKDQNNMHYRASTNVDGEERGFMSEVFGITFNDGDFQKHRGKRGIIIEIEEFGTLGSAETIYNVARSSVEEGDVVFGTILGFGTGGTEAADFGAMEKMFYNPEAYNIRCFDNKWDEGMQGTKCAYFTPSYRNIKFKDDKGNSNEILAKEFRDKERAMAAKSPDANAILQEKSEHPYTPQEAILKNSYSVLPANEAIEWYHKVLGSGLHKIGVNGRLENIDGKIQFIVDDKVKPILNFPHNIQEELTGCIVQYYSPFRVNGRVPDNLYIIAHDPYAFDQSSDSESLGAAYVYMQPNNIPGAPFGDRIVATYYGRPKTLDDYNRNLFKLAQFYNAKIGFENDRGDVIGYAKRFQLLDWLSEEFELAFDAELKGSKVKRNFGMHIGTGKNNVRKNKGDRYLADWLITERGKDVDGLSRMNLQTIYCPATLKEISMYRTDGGNFDRISALRILAYYRQEIVFKDLQIEVNHNDSNKHGFFNRKHF